jgi:septum formation protein
MHPSAGTSQRLILASASLGRRLLLEQLGRPFEILPTNIDEPTAFPDPRTFVQTVSWLKAAAAVANLTSTERQGIVIAADTIGWIDGHAVLKPADEADARRILHQLGGRTHELWTGVVLWRLVDGLQLIWQERSLVDFKKLTDPEIDHYLATRTWRGCSGAYAVKEEGDPYVTLVAGSLSNVIGLPMESLTRNLSLLETFAQLGPAP